MTFLVGFKLKIAVIRLIGISSLVLFGYLFVGKQVLLPILGTTTNGRIIGFKSTYFSRKPTYTNTKKSWKARSVYFRFCTATPTDSLTLLNEGSPLWGILNYQLHDTVMVAYWPLAPSTATIINWREYPLFFLLGLIGWVFTFGKPPLRVNK